GDHVGDAEGLARAGHAQQGLVRQAGLQALDHLADRLRLIAGRLEAGYELKNRHDPTSVTSLGRGRQSTEMRVGIIAARRLSRYTTGTITQPLVQVLTGRCRFSHLHSPSSRTMSLFSAVEMAPRDPILGLNEAFNADPRPHKVNLGVGVYFTEEGRIPLLRAVAEAERARIEAHAPRGYLPIEGIAAYDGAVQKLLFGQDSALLAEGRVVTTQAVGGTGALKTGADFIKRLLPDAVVAISD